MSELWCEVGGLGTVGGVVRRQAASERVLLSDPDVRVVAVEHRGQLARLREKHLRRRSVTGLWFRG